MEPKQLHGIDDDIFQEKPKARPAPLRVPTRAATIPPAEFTPLEQRPPLPIVEWLQQTVDSIVEHWPLVAGTATVSAVITLWLAAATWSYQPKQPEWDLIRTRWDDGVIDAQDFKIGDDVDWGHEQVLREAKRIWEEERDGKVNPDRLSVCKITDRDFFRGEDGYYEYRATFEYRSIGKRYRVFLVDRSYGADYFEFTVWRTK